MPVQQRPTAVTVIAVINFIVGGLGLLGLLCGGAALLFLFSVLGNVNPPPGQPNPLKEVQGLFESIPGYIPFIIASSVLGGIWAIVLIVAGVGLLRMRRWARLACLVYAIYTILGTVGSTIYTFAVVIPATEKWQADFEAKLRRKGPGGAPAPTGPPPTANMVTNRASAVGGALYGMAYALVLLVVLNLPHVRAAFAGGGVSTTDEGAARAWKRDELPDYGEERRGRLGGGPDDRFTEPDERRY